MGLDTYSVQISCWMKKSYVLSGGNHSAGDDTDKSAATGVIRFMMQYMKREQQP